MLNYKFLCDVLQRVRAQLVAKLKRLKVKHIIKALWEKCSNFIRNQQIIIILTADDILAKKLVSSSLAKSSESNKVFSSQKHKRLVFKIVNIEGLSHGKSWFAKGWRNHLLGIILLDPSQRQAMSFSAVNTNKVPIIYLFSLPQSLLAMDPLFCGQHLCGITFTDKMVNSEKLNEQCSAFYSNVVYQFSYRFHHHVDHDLSWLDQLQQTLNIVKETKHQTVAIQAIYYLDLQYNAGITLQQSVAICNEQSHMTWFKRSKLKLAWTSLLALSLLTVFIVGSNAILNNRHLATTAVSLANFEQPLAANTLEHKLYQLSNIIQSLQHDNTDRHWVYALLTFNIKSIMQSRLNNIAMHQLFKLFAKPMMLQLAHDLQSNKILQQHKTSSKHAQALSDYYLQLESYLLLYHSQRPYFPGTLTLLTEYYENWLWQTHNIAGNGQQFNSRQMVSYYLQHHYSGKVSNRPLSLDSDVVKKARQQLGQGDYLRNIYLQFKREKLTHYPAKRLQTWLKDFPQSFASTTKLSFYYSKQAWDKDIQPSLQQLANIAAQGDWVVNEPLAHLNASVVPTIIKSSDNIIKIRQQLDELYFSDVLDYWIQQLYQWQLPAVHSAQQVSSLLSNVLRHRVYQQLVALVGDNTSYIEKLSHNADIRDKVTALNSLHSAIGQKVLQQYLSKISAVVNDLQQLLANPKSTQQATNYAKKILLGDGNNTTLYQAKVALQVLLMDSNEPSVQRAYKHLLQEPIRLSWEWLLMLTRKYLQQQWQQQVERFYHEKLSKDYPFKNTTKDASLVAVNTLLRPNDGLLWNFNHHQLSGFINEASDNWKVNRWLGRGLAITTQQLRQLSTINKLSLFLFSSQGKTIAVKLAVKAEPSTAIGMLALSFNQKTYRYYNGPQRWQAFNWQPSNEDKLSLLIMNKQQQQLTAQGPWALLHLIDQAKLSIHLDKTCQLKWIIQQEPVVLTADPALCQLISYQHSGILKSLFH